jgi:hypothetical protein
MFRRKGKGKGSAKAGSATAALPTTDYGSTLERAMQVAERERLEEEARVQVRRPRIRTSERVRHTCDNPGLHMCTSWGGRRSSLQLQQVEAMCIQAPHHN